MKKANNHNESKRLDPLSPEERSQRMGLVRYKDTKPELRVRRLAYAMGYRYRLHRKALPGCPDLVFVKKRKAIFVHGCFWHRHKGCVRCRLPKTRLDFWKPKLEANAERDKKNLRELKKLNWKTLVVWECQTENADKLRLILKRFLEDSE